MRATTGAQTQLFILLGAFVLLKGVAYWFDRYGIDFSQRGLVTTGASYTDVNAVLPAKTVLAVIAVMCALLFFAGAIRRSAMLPAVGFGLLVLSAILIGGVYPAIIQQFVVKPNELAKESKYIAREIAATRRAYAVGGTRVITYPGTPPGSPSQLTGQVAGLHGLRLMDPAVVSQTFQQLQQVKGFYQFPGQLAVDRYVLPGGGKLPQDVVVAARGLSGPPPGQGNWINTHLVYTHGFGIVAAKADTVGPAAARRSWRATYRRAASSARSSRGCTSASRRTPMRSSARRPAGRAGARLPVRERERPEELHLHRQRRRAGGLAAEPLPVRRQVP